MPRLYSILLLLLLASLCSARAQVLRVPRPRSSTASTFNPYSTTNNQNDPAYCPNAQGQQKGIAKPFSVLYSDAPAPTVVTFISGTPQNKPAFINITLISYIQNGTVTNGNVSLPIWLVSGTKLLSAAPSTASTTQANQVYGMALSGLDGIDCGTDSGPFSSTRCVLRYVFDYSTLNSGTASMISCADVQIKRRDTVPLTVNVKLNSGDAPILPSTIFTRFSNSDFAKSQPFDFYQLSTDDFPISNVLKLSDPPTTRFTTSYTINFQVNTVVDASSSQFAARIAQAPLSTILGVTVINASACLSPSTLIVMLTALITLLISRL